MTSHVSDGAADGGRWYITRVRRYLLAGVGPIMLAGTHFAISFAMLRLDVPMAFGIFTFLFVAAQLTIALAVALFGAPLQALPTARDPGDRDAAAGAILSAATAMAIVVGFGFAAFSLVIGLWPSAAVMYGIYAATMILRWVGRAWSFADDRPMQAAASDIIYGVVVLSAFVIGIYGLHRIPEGTVYAALALGSTTSLVAFGRRYAALLFARPSLSAWRRYGAVWQGQSRWALLGVVTTEAVANVHIYMVTLAAGAYAIAPIAAAALLLRPINVVQNALADFERSQMAQLMADRALGDLRRTMRLFLAVLIAIWGASTVLALCIVHFVPRLAFSQDYDLREIELATVSWIVVTLIILLQMPANVMLQAAGDFRALARTTMMSSVVNVTAVAIALFCFEPVWTVIAMAIGWTVDLVLVQRASGRRWRLLDSGASARL